MTAKITRVAGLLTVSMPMLVACLGGACSLAFAAGGEPKLRSGRIDSAVIHIGALPRAPRVTLDLHGETERVALLWTGPAGQTLEDYFYTNEPNGRAVLDGTGISASFSAYAAAGTWTLTTIYVCKGGGCSEYTGDPLAALFPSLTLTVVNPHADTTPPTVSAAVVNTPTVVTSKESTIEVGMTMQDDVSGVASAQVVFSNTHGSFTVGGELGYAIKSSATYQLTGYLRDPAPGSYSASKVVLQDAAGNQITITDTGKISTLFGGQPVVTITN